MPETVTIPTVHGDEIVPVGSWMIDPIFGELGRATARGFINPRYPEPVPFDDMGGISVVLSNSPDRPYIDPQSLTRWTLCEIECRKLTKPKAGHPAYGAVSSTMFTEVKRGMMRHATDQTRGTPLGPCQIIRVIEITE